MKRTILAVILAASALDAFAQTDATTAVSSSDTCCTVRFVELSYPRLGD